MNRHAGEHTSRHLAAHVSGLPAALPTYQGLSQTFALDSLPLGAWSSTIPARQGVLFRCLPTQLPRGVFSLLCGPSPHPPFLDPDIAPGLAKRGACLGTLVLSCSPSYSDPPLLFLSRGWWWWWSWSIWS